jgi:hypothetical protein
MGEDHAAVAARAEDGGVGGVFGYDTEIIFVAVTQAIRNSGSGQSEVGSGIAIGNGENIDAVELGATVLHELAACDE